MKIEFSCISIPHRILTTIESKDFVPYLYDILIIKSKYFTTTLIEI